MPEDGCIYYPCRCLDCGWSGKEWYNLEFSEFTGETNEEGVLNQKIQTEGIIL